MAGEGRGVVSSTAAALRNLSLRTKLVLALVGVGAAAVAVTGAEGYLRARRAIEADILDQRVAVDRRDEVGQIAVAFNQMAADLQETTVSRDYVTNILDSRDRGARRLPRALHVDRAGARALPRSAARRATRLRRPRLLSAT